MRIIYTICLSLFALLLLSPLTQMQFEVVRRGRLQGVTQPKNPPILTLRSFLDGEYQKAIEVWLMKRSGLWAYLVRADNQINYSLFGQVSSNYNHTVVLGKNGFLYEKEYVFGYNRQSVVADEKIEALAANLEELQTLLAERDIGFTLLVSASKAELYPENIPESFLDSSRIYRESSYEKLIPRLEAKGVNILDGQRFFEERKGSVPYYFFAETGTHWNQVGACLIVSELSKKMQSIFSKPMRDLSCESVYAKETPRKAERDILEMCNLWDQSSLYRPTTYPKAKRILVPDAFRPKVLVVGSSFVWSLLPFFERHRLISSSNFYYYYNRDRRWPKPREKRLNRAAIDWEVEVFSKDMIVIEINAVAVESAGFGFIEDAIRQLKFSQKKVVTG